MISEKHLIKAAAQVCLEKLRRGPTLFRLEDQGQVSWYLALNTQLFSLRDSSWWPAKQTTGKGDKIVDVFIQRVTKSLFLRNVTCAQFEEETGLDIVTTLLNLTKKLQEAY